MPRSMPVKMIVEVIRSFGDAAKRMQEAGLDGVEIVASHGNGTDLRSKRLFVWEKGWLDDYAWVSKTKPVATEYQP